MQVNADVDFPTEMMVQKQGYAKKQYQQQGLRKLQYVIQFDVLFTLNDAEVDEIEVEDKGCDEGEEDEFVWNQMKDIQYTHTDGCAD